MARSESIGALLQRLNLINEAQLEAALQEQRRVGGRIGETLVRLGHVTEGELTWALAHQLDIPYIPHLDTRPEALDAAAVAAIPGELAHRIGAFPVFHDPDALTVVMEDPLNALAVKALERAARLPIRVAMCEATEIRRAISEVYPESITGDTPTFASVVGWGLGPETRAELLADVSGESLIQWLTDQARRSGATAVRLYPGGGGGLVVAEGGSLGREVLKLPVEWYTQAVSYLVRPGFNTVDVRTIQVDAGTAVWMALAPQPEWDPGEVEAVLEAVADLTPGLVLICGTTPSLRGRVSVPLARGLVGDAVEVMAVGDAEAPVGASRVAGGVTADASRHAMAGRARVVVMPEGAAATLPDLVRAGRPMGWVLVPVGASTLIEILADMRDLGVPAGSLSAALAGVVEADVHGVRWLGRDDDLRAAILGWDLESAATWRGRQLDRPVRGALPVIDAGRRGA